MELQLQYGKTFYPISAPGHLGLISGQPSVDKSKLTEPLIASYINNKNTSSFFRWKGVDKGTKVLMVDTEQPDDLLNNAIERIKVLSGLKEKDFNNRFDVLRLANVGSNGAKFERFKDQVKDIGKYGFVLADNMSGLINSMNSEVEATIFSNFLNALCSNNNLTTIVLSHVSSNNTPIGHTGKGVQRLSSLSLILTKDEDSGFTFCERDKCRLSPSLPSFHFKVNQENGDVIPGVYMPFP